jgi:DNA-binding CsgD family transcriptional regulator
LIVASEIAFAVNDIPRAMSLAETARDLAQAAGDTPLAVTALTALGSAAARERRPDASETLERAIATAGTGLPAEATTAWFELSRAHLLRGDFEMAAGAARSGLAIARAHGLEVLQARLLSQLTTIHINHGEYAKARETAEQAVALARPGTLAADTARTSLGHVLANQAEFEGALGIFDEIAYRVRGWDVDRQITYHAFHAQALLGARRLDAADRAAREAVALTVANPGMGMTGFLNAAAVVEARRDVAAAQELAATFERYFAGRSTGPIEAVRLEIAAVVEWCARRPAADAFVRAAEAYERIGAHVHALYRRASAAIAQLEAGHQRAAARTELRALRARLRERGALRYSSLIDDALQRPRARQRTRQLLTGSDLRVAVLLARGASDARIARDIGIAQREATRRVRSVLRTLGVESRSQVASWAIARAPLPRSATPR